MTAPDQAVQNEEDGQIRSRLTRLAVLTTVASLGVAATLPFARFSPGFVAYVIVLSVVVVGSTWKLSGPWVSVVPGMLAGGTLSWAVRTFYDLPPILSLAGLHILSLFAAVFGATTLLLRSLQHRRSLLPRPPTQS